MKHEPSRSDPSQPRAPRPPRLPRPRAPLAFDAPTALERSDRRRERRLNYNKSIAVAFFEPGDVLSRPRRVTAEDISAGGIRLSGSTPFTLGNTGVVQLTREDGTFGLVGVRVVHTRSINAFTHSAGARFVSLPRELVLDRFIRPDGQLLSLDPLAASA